MPLYQAASHLVQLAMRVKLSHQLHAKQRVDGFIQRVALMEALQSQRMLCSVLRHQCWVWIGVFQVLHDGITFIDNNFAISECRDLLSGVDGCQLTAAMLTYICASYAFFTGAVPGSIACTSARQLVWSMTCG